LRAKFKERFGYSEKLLLDPIFCFPFFSLAMTLSEFLPVLSDDT
jgi:hypothetical protein